MTNEHDEMDNVDVTPTSPAGVGGIDPLYQQMYGTGAPVEVAPRQVGFPVAPRFSYYVLQPVKATRNRSETNVGARVQVKVQEGPEGTVGMTINDSQNVAYGFIVAKSYEKRTGEKVTLTEEEWQKKVTKRRGLLARIQKVLGLGMAVPPSFSDAHVDAYAAQFATARPFIAEVRIEKGQDGVERNRIVWESVATFDEPEHDASGKPTGETAIQKARREITNFAQKAAKAGKPAGGQSAASLSHGDLT